MIHAQDCEVTNEQFGIDKVLTAKLEPRSLKKKSISDATYKLKDIKADHNMIRNSATHDIIQHLLEESREAEVLGMEKNILDSLFYNLQK